MTRPIRLLVLLLLGVAWPRPVCSQLVAADGPDTISASTFRSTVAPILIRRCLECHRGSQPSGGLNLSSAQSLAVGGESGDPLSSDADQSLLWQRIVSGEMPPEDKLSEQEIRVIRSWLDSGAPWDGKPIDLYEMTTVERAGYDWWSLQPIVDPPVPDIGVPVQNPIDAFVIRRLRDRGLALSPRAEPRTLVRRLSVRLHGVHPDPQTVATLQRDRSPDRFDRLLLRFLHSPRYGERWARHWLDVARFGESQGFERDKARPDAWRYRDWVINALNRDMPYDQFARMQIAGDCISDLEPNQDQPWPRREGIIATGFLVAGAYDEVGQNQQSAAMRAVVRQDEMEDYVGTLGQAFLGLTTNCARCHDHKFDPIEQSEYYALCSALDGVRHGRREITDQATLRAARQRAADIKERLQTLRDQLAELQRPLIQQLISQSRGQRPMLARPLAHWDFEGNFNDRYGNLDGQPRGGARIERGDLVVDGKSAYVQTSPLGIDLVEKTLSVRLTLDNLQQRGGGAISVLDPKTATFDAVVYGEREPRRWMAGSDHFRRSRNVGGPDERDAANRSVHLAICYRGDGTITLYRDGKSHGTAYQTDQHQRFGTDAVVVFGIRLFPPGGNRMLAGRIHEASLFDRALDAAEVRALAAGATFIDDSMLTPQMSPSQRRRHAELQQQIARLVATDTSVPRQYAYAVNPVQPGQPTRRLVRGNPSSPAEVVAPGGLASLKGPPAEFGLPAVAPEANRRRKLAAWIACRENPLFARVIVNRLWQHHFGTGLVNTPNDFGFSGGRPSHPELLDYLAARLIESGWSLKSVHRLIIGSATWQQATRHHTTAAELDAGNRLLWRGNRIRLDAESIRDSMLLAAGQLNELAGGPSYQDFETFNFNSQFYNVIDPIGAEFHRRTIYRMIIRSGRNRMLDAFDCPDPSATAPRRAVTTTPLQSLSLMNHSFVLRMADHFSDRLQREAGDDAAAQVERAVQIVWHRQPTRAERDSMIGFAQQYGLPALCRVLFNSNEFLYVD